MKGFEGFAYGLAGGPAALAAPDGRWRWRSGRQRVWPCRWSARGHPGCPSRATVRRPHGRRRVVADRRGHERAGLAAGWLQPQIRPPRSHGGLRRNQPRHVPSPAMLLWGLGRILRFACKAVKVAASLAQCLPSEIATRNAAAFRPGATCDHKSGESSQGLSRGMRFQRRFVKHRGGSCHVTLLARILGHYGVEPVSRGCRGMWAQRLTVRSCCHPARGGGFVIAGTRGALGRQWGATSRVGAHRK